MIPFFVGYDPRESIAHHVLEQSIIDRSSVPVAIIPLHAPMLRDFDGQQDGANAFIYSRFLVPELMDFQGWAIYCDSDMLFLSDPEHLWALRDESKAVMVCKHEYKTRQRWKSIGTAMESKNEDYERKNWSSMVLWNCGHPSNRIVNREFASSAGGKALHRFTWLRDEEIGSIPLSWNWLVGEYENNPGANLVHFTLGMPGFDYYRNCDYSREWKAALDDVERRDCLKAMRIGGRNV